MAGVAVGVLTGDGTTTAFDLPRDYDRMLKAAELRSSRTSRHSGHRRQRPVAGYGNRQFNQVAGMWTIHGGQIHVRPASSPGKKVNFSHVERMGQRRPGVTEECLLDTDLFRLSESLRARMIWKWRAQKGLPYAQDQTTRDAKE